ncbi:unnamed protein product, partial [Rotaria sordida]
MVRYETTSSSTPPLPPYNA